MASQLGTFWPTSEQSLALHWQPVGPAQQVIPGLALTTAEQSAPSVPSSRFKARAPEQKQYPSATRDTQAKASQSQDPSPLQHRPTAPCVPATDALEQEGAFPSPVHLHP
jgi:hypothetical protein